MEKDCMENAFNALKIRMKEVHRELLEEQA